MRAFKNYREAVRHARAYCNVTRNLELLRQEWMAEFGLTEADLLCMKMERERMPHHEFPPPQAGASTEIRGKLRGYREARQRGAGRRNAGVNV